MDNVQKLSHVQQETSVKEFMNNYQSTRGNSRLVPFITSRLSQLAFTTTVSPIWSVRSHFSEVNYKDRPEAIHGLRR
jgi:hypothetical protein